MFSVSYYFLFYFHYSPWIVIIGCHSILIVYLMWKFPWFAHKCSAKPCKRYCLDRLCKYIDGLMQERRNSIVNSLELRLSCTNPSISPRLTRHIVSGAHVWALFLLSLFSTDNHCAIDLKVLFLSSKYALFGNKMVWVNRHRVNHFRADLGRLYCRMVSKKGHTLQFIYSSLHQSW